MTPPYKRTILVEVVEEWDGNDHSWSATASLPDSKGSLAGGRILAFDLSDDMPQSPGQAVESAGRQLDHNLALRGWEALHK